MADHLKHFAENLRNSPWADYPAMQHFIDGLEQVQVGNEADASTLEKSGVDLNKRLEDWGSHLSQKVNLPKVNLSQPRSPLLQSREPQVFFAEYADLCRSRQRQDPLHGACS